MDENEKKDPRPSPFIRKETKGLLMAVRDKESQVSKAEKKSTKSKLDHSLLESRVREELVRQLVRLFKSRHGSTENSSEDELGQVYLSPIPALGVELFV